MAPDLRFVPQPGLPEGFLQSGIRNELGNPGEPVPRDPPDGSPRYASECLRMLQNASEHSQNLRISDSQKLRQTTYNKSIPGNRLSDVWLILYILLGFRFLFKFKIVNKDSI